MPFVRGTAVDAWRCGERLGRAPRWAWPAVPTSCIRSAAAVGPKQVADPDSAAPIGVNGYLWRATLDTLAFMPLASADPYGGVVITDWYANPEKPDERFKCTVYILDTRLRADGLNVAVFKQVKRRRRHGSTPPSASQTETDIENAILTRARQLRLSNIKG